MTIVKRLRRWANEVVTASLGGFIGLLDPSKFVPSRAPSREDRTDSGRAISAWFLLAHAERCAMLMLRPRQAS